MQQYWVLDVTSDKDVPKEVADEVREHWADMELGNDYYYTTLATKWMDENDHSLDATIEYVKAQGLDPATDNILLHFWW